MGSSFELSYATVRFPTRLKAYLRRLNLGMLLTALDFNIVATAVPIISSEFNKYSNSSWLGTGFLISFALGLPLYAKLGDIFGRRNMFVFATIIFILGSGLCGGSKSMDMLIWSRVVQGAGGGGIYGLVNVSISTIRSYCLHLIRYASGYHHRSCPPARSWEIPFLHSLNLGCRRRCRTSPWWDILSVGTRRTFNYVNC